MYNKRLEALDKALRAAAIEAKEVAELLGKDIADSSKEGQKNDPALEAKEYAYSYIKDGLDGCSRILVAVKHADIFMEEGKKLSK